MKIAIAGKQGAGKNFVAEYITTKIPNMKIMGLADGIKEEYCNIKNINLKDLENLKNTVPEIRSHLIYIAEYHKIANPYYWVDRLIGFNNIIVPDFRFKTEAQRFKENNFVLIRVECSREIRSTRRTLSNEEHYSETDLDDYKDFDYMIDNSNSIERTYKEIDNILANLFPYYSINN